MLAVSDTVQPLAMAILERFTGSYFLTIRRDSFALCYCNYVCFNFSNIFTIFLKLLFTHWKIRNIAVLSCPSTS